MLSGLRLDGPGLSEGKTPPINQTAFEASLLRESSDSLLCLLT